VDSSAPTSTLEDEMMDVEPPAAPTFDDIEDDVGPTLFDADFGEDDDINDENEGHQLPESTLDSKETQISNHSSQKNGNLVEKILMQKVGSEVIIDLANEFSYVMVDSSHTKKNWTGINHWKIPKSKGETKNKKRSEMKLKELINFESFDYDESAFESSSSLSSNCMASSTITKQNATSNVLPVDMHYSMDNLMKPFGIPLKTDTHAARITNVEKSQTQTASHNVQDEDDDDNEGFGGFGGGDDFVEGILIDTTVSNEIKEDPREVLLDLTNIDTMKLIDAPKKAEKMKIGYAKTSSKIDVKILKDDIFSEINTKKNSYKFSNVIDSVRKSESKTPSNVSIPYCFICLLHLANENGLEISGKEDLSDLSIVFPQ
jgi:condensin complex subunit 2